MWKIVYLTYQFSSGQKSSSIELDLLLKVCGQEPKNVILRKLIMRFLSFLPTSCSAALPPHDHLTSRLSSSREMKFNFPVQELLLWKMRFTLSLRDPYNQQPRDYRSVWWVANPREARERTWGGKKSPMLSTREMLTHRQNHLIRISKWPLWIILRNHRKTVSVVYLGSLRCHYKVKATPQWRQLV